VAEPAARNAPTSRLQNYSSTMPFMQVMVPPPTQMVSWSSRERWTRPSRPSAVPCRAR